MKEYGKVDIVVEEVLKRKNISLTKFCKLADLQFNQGKGYKGNNIVTCKLI